MDLFHVHVERDDKTAKFWISPTRLHHSRGFRQPELSRIRKLIEEKQEDIVSFWNGYFGS